MRLSIALMGVPLAAVHMVSAQMVCTTDGSPGPESVLQCLGSVVQCATTLTDEVALSSCECSYVRAALSCYTSICGDSIPSTSDIMSLSSQYCGGGGSAATTTDSAASMTGSQASATASVASATSSAGAEHRGLKQEVFVVAVVGLVGALV
ncbi:uncharacterized protein Z520_03148 [Fonsecaea multimorphosa CBS 102226]|uniref:Extracellular membrane protein CFEM domain-containing protein n=1 Tax=Fonsecaea multimorphosa CBS 102226 TaxID=1442371 RepID=A0A0D2HI51_9EURO|nr:uncharacterized protein Z520_03148 [Fonsecaea multimorphosa CBS 102226]KIY01596.1 hypothetical protein Z520_03148 [Fonsecaea multimorphosa CBS 102226]